MRINTQKAIRAAIRSVSTTNGTQWVRGRLQIDGVDVQKLVESGEAHGLVKRSREHFPQDGKVITKRRHPRPSLSTKRAEALKARLAAGIESKTHKMLRLRRENAHKQKQKNHEQ